MTAGCSVYTGLQCGECWEGDATGVRVIVGRRLLLSSKWSLEKAVAPHSSTLAWKIPWMEEPGELRSMGSLRVRHAWRLHFHFSVSRIGEGNGHLLQCSCLENPRDGGAWWAAVYGVTQSQTQLSDLAAAASLLQP